MRLFVLMQGCRLEDQPGYHDGFQRLKAEGMLADYQAIPYYGVAQDYGWPGVWEEAERRVRALGADAVFLQCFHGPIPDPAIGIGKLRSCPTRPTIFTSLADGFGVWLRPIPQCYKIASRLADLNFMTSMGRPAQDLARRGSKNLVLMPHGCCQVRFSSALDRTAYQPAFDVVFIGNRQRSRWVIGYKTWYGIWRDCLVSKLTKRFGSRFALFGRGWEGQRSWQGAIPFHLQLETVRKARIQVGGYPGAMGDFYTSDREFIGMAAGIPFVDYWVPGIECLFENGREWWLGKTLDDMVHLTERLIERTTAEQLQIGESVRQEILAHHTHYHRCQQMIEIVSRYREQKLAGRPAELPRLPFLRFPSASGNRVLNAVINWQG